MSFDGALAFSISSGVTKAHVSFINHEDFIFDAIYGVTVDARALKEGGNKKKLNTTIENEFIGIPFYAIKIPNIIIIGPQVIVNAAASVYLDAHGEFRAGARFTLEAGELTLDAMNSSRNIASGFKPSLEPIFEITKGNVVATADLALPVGVEAALDILGGTWKKAIGIYTAPSVYLTAGVSKNEGHACDSGIELRFGAKNRIYSSALGIWEYEFKRLGITFFETGLGCLSTKGWDKNQVEPTTHFHDEIIAKFGGEDQLATNKTIQLIQPEPVIYDDEHFTEENKKEEEQKLRRLPESNGFRLIQDAGQASTLVSGKDGYLYMVNNSAEYDISAPWGSLKVDENIFNYDVFGRLLYHNWQDGSRASMRDLHVTAARHMPDSVVLIKDSDVEAYGVTFQAGNKFGKKLAPLEPTMYSQGDNIPYDIQFVQPDDFWSPTVCQIKGRGLRLYATHYLVGEDGKPKIRGEMPQGYLDYHPED
ncbi:uncharacterized protein N7483_001770 [Penicillium malachiteum]|uniref:uncharacterized protein n=1 Tax=Penicillium malachiteum TaxID=1324776 RepID=UPI0025469983|nr:uncharacterized protein N7483_001770 [Penicillium malachiteum]KAJ5736645.1 hypothetical protein N7483_001770 [Penicillium malachiteum]